MISRPASRKNTDTRTSFMERPSFQDLIAVIYDMR
jgi:hypothetical protein